MYTLESVSFCRVQILPLYLYLSLVLYLAAFVTHFDFVSVFVFFVFFFVGRFCYVKANIYGLVIDLDAFHHGDICIYLQYHFLKMQN